MDELRTPDHHLNERHAPFGLAVRLTVSYLLIMTNTELATKASIRWYALSRASERRSGAIEARVRNAARAGIGRAYRVLWANAERNRYGFRVDHTGHCLTVRP